MKHGHNEMVRFGIMRKIDGKRMFAVWRIDAPWKPQTKKGNKKASVKTSLKITEMPNFKTLAVFIHLIIRTA